MKSKVQAWSEMDEICQDVCQTNEHIVIFDVFAEQRYTIYGVLKKAIWRNITSTFRVAMLKVDM